MFVFCLDECTVFIGMAFSKPVGRVEYAAFVSLAIGLKNTVQALQHYPVPKSSHDARPQLAQLATDYVMSKQTPNTTHKTEHHIHMHDKLYILVSVSVDLFIEILFCVCDLYSYSFSL